ncbi:MAG: serine protease [Candidatus Methanomethylophilus sp.]|jgi:hypothetical protein|nr:serine protease [Methanomethylophilus sp.]MCI2074178.1 serine protease [Methanomethylophilus sp.]MCI2093025.1 serine protease [Methanomethylophilus sp.]
MFAKACQKAYRFTRPLIVNTRSVDGTVSSSLGTFFVVNPEGWVLTAGHLFDSYMQFRQDQTKIKGVEEINAKAPAGTEKVKLDPKWLTNHSFWWGWDGVRLADVYVNREIDVCLGRLEGFKPDMVSEYPVFRDPETMLPGTSICRTGFPFANVAADFDEKCNAFRIRPGVLPIAFFPNDGIHTRNIITSQSSKDGGYQVMYVETSTPGLKGQSGGPIFDTEGRIYAMQVRTNHMPLGFHPVSNFNGKEVVENQFMNVGIGVHGKVLQDIMRDKHVSFRTECTTKDGSNYTINE